MLNIPTQAQPPISVMIWLSVPVGHSALPSHRTTSRLASTSTVRWMIWSGFSFNREAIAICIALLLAVLCVGVTLQLLIVGLLELLQL